jgi:hypothetical protein
MKMNYSWQLLIYNVKGFSSYIWDVFRGFYYVWHILNLYFYQENVFTCIWLCVLEEFFISRYIFSRVQGSNFHVVRRLSGSLVWLVFIYGITGNYLSLAEFKGNWWLMFHTSVDTFTARIMTFAPKGLALFQLVISWLSTHKNYLDILHPYKSLYLYII